MRDAFSETLYEEAQKNSEICIVVADISPVGSMNKFTSEYPERFINVGVAEQVMIGICAGMAHKGMQPFAYTIAPFALYRPFEMVRDDLGYQKLPVTVVGMGAGVIYSSLGSTHHTQEDISIASSIPSMQVIAPCDPLETSEATRFCASQKNGPVYLRIGKGGHPILTGKVSEPWIFGKIRYLQHGTDVCILSYGGLMEKALKVSEELESKGKSVSVVSVHTLKPLDHKGIIEAMLKHPEVIVMEEHVPQGGLASQTVQLAWQSNASCNLHTFTLRDEFIHCYGSYDELLAAHGITVERIVEAVGHR